ncbi:MAG TPA: hypothetical protein VGC21_13290 [Telluria sp.]|jgi:hypothetical protein
MRIDYLSADILLFRGDSLAALATAFIDGERVLLVDALASQYDAFDLRDYLENTLHKRVEQIVLTAADGSHAAAVPLFPEAQLTGALDAPELIGWGRHTLALHAEAGALQVDVPSADLQFVGDSIVGNIATVGTFTPEQTDAHLARLQDRGRTRVVPRHTAAACSRALGNARAYLAELGARVRALRARFPAPDAAAAIARLPLDPLLPKGEFATPLEHHWHAENLKRIVERGLFPAATPQAAGERRGRARTCCDTVGSVLMAMLGRLVERGV